MARNLSSRDLQRVFTRIFPKLGDFFMIFNSSLVFFFVFYKFWDDGVMWWHMAVDAQKLIRRFAIH